MVKAGLSNTTDLIYSVSTVSGNTKAFAFLLSNLLPLGIILDQSLSVYHNTKYIRSILSDSESEKTDKLKKLSIEFLQLATSITYLSSFFCYCLKLHSFHAATLKAASFSAASVALLVNYSAEALKEGNKFICAYNKWKRLKSEINENSSLEAKQALENVKTEMVEKGISFAISLIKLAGSIIMFFNPIVGSAIILSAILIKPVLIKLYESSIKKHDGAKKSRLFGNFFSFFDKDKEPPVSRKELTQTELTTLKHSCSSCLATTASQPS